ncbi:unnamed protein product [Adineta ricciae]|uniref:Uncharacterized protein n=1 Tax=Adineta ricciae TaxID=249248 RepID=A0A815ML29_ADIRI|nr:unnamed protein product [Adineta ricciae]
MVGQFIDTVWRKSFIGDLRRAMSTSHDDSQWAIVRNGKTYQFQFVWVQGLCTKVDKNAGIIVIEDATGQAELKITTRVKDAWSTVEGDYVMAVGKLVSATSSDRLIIDLYKLQCFKTVTKTELQWPFEIVDITRRVYH